ncbi:CTP synthase [Candidatus Dependentiae bacterium]|nr:CTP synthase [Candidatus Dependentiae bacterium]
MTKKLDTKFIVLTGGVCSSIGKGVLVASMGTLLKNAGYSVSVVKWDPYLNVDPGTMSPLEHGEVFVTNDGAETDLDLGHYERVLETHLSALSSVSSGQIFKEIVDKERNGEFLGKCIQLVPHVVDAIKARLIAFAKKEKTDFVLLEIGGTVGDMEGEIFLESVRQLKMQLGPHQMLHSHLSLVPYLSWANEIKTKPTQHSVMTLKRAGLDPDCLFLRTMHNMDKQATDKLAIMCGVDKEMIFQVPTCSPIYKLFIKLAKQNLHKKIQAWMGIKRPKETDLSRWKNLIQLIEKKKKKVKIGLIAKYVGRSDPYISVLEAIKSAAYACNRDVEIVVIEAEKLETERATGESWKQLKSLDGIVIPGGFDKRGIEGKIKATKWAREKNVPFLGLCLGMHVMLIEYARSVIKLKGASSTEFDKNSPHPVICLIEEQRKITQKGGSMRLGAYPCTLKPNTIARKAYGKSLIQERHRHRYEVNNAYKEQFEKGGVVFSGIYKDKDLVEISENATHKFMVGVQFHPEFLSTPLKPHPLFKAFMEAIV